MIAVPLSDDLHADVHCISFEEVYGLAACFSHVDVWAHGGNGIPMQSVQWDIEAPADLLCRYMMHPPTDMQQKHCNRKGVSRAGLCRLLESGVLETDSHAAYQVDSCLAEIFGDVDDQMVLMEDDFQMVIQHLCGGYHDLFMSESEQDNALHSPTTTTGTFLRRNSQMGSIDSMRLASPLALPTAKFARIPSINSLRSASPVSIRSNDSRRTGSSGPMEQTPLRVPQRSLGLVRSDSRESLSGLVRSHSTESLSSIRSIGAKQSKDKMKKAALRMFKGTIARAWDKWVEAVQDTIEEREVKNLMATLKRWQMFYCGGSPPGLMSDNKVS